MNDYQRNRGHACDSQEWFFKMLGASEYKYAWASPEKEEEMKCRHTEHARRSSGLFGRYFKDMNDSNGSWELCWESMAPEICFYCDGRGNSTAGGPCGFCIEGAPRDTQEDWDNTWGKTFDFLNHMRDEVTLSKSEDNTSRKIMKEGDEA